MILKSLSRCTALAKSPTSIAARIASFSAIRCNSSGSAPSAPSTLRKASTRLRPFALTGEGERAPQRRVVLIADHRIGEILLRRFDATQHDVGDGAQNERRRIFGGRALVGDGGVEHGLGLGVHLAREIEAREIEPRLGAPGDRRLGRGADQFELPLRVFGLAVVVPALGVEDHRAGGLFLLRRRGVRQRQAAGPRQDHLVGRQLGLEVVGKRLHGDALRARQRAEIDEVLALDQAARRSKPGDDQKPVADVGIVKPMRLARLVERDGDAGASGPDDVAGDDEGLGRARHRVADRDEPAGILRLDADEPRPFELEPHHLGVVLARYGGAADGLALVVAEHADVELGLGVEHQPQRVGALEHRRGRRRSERKEQPQIVALPPEFGDDRTPGSRLAARAGASGSFAAGAGGSASSAATLGMATAGGAVVGATPGLGFCEPGFRRFGF